MSLFLTSRRKIREVEVEVLSPGRVEGFALHAAPPPAPRRLEPTPQPLEAVKVERAVEPIDVIEVPEAQQLGLAAEELDAPRARLLHAPLHVAVLLGGHREEDHAAGQVLEGAGLQQPHRRAEQARHLRVVAAGVRGPRLGIRDRMAGHHETIELAEQGEGRAVLDARGLGPHSGEGEAAPRLQAELAQSLLGEPRGLELLEAELGLAATEPVPVDGQTVVPRRVRMRQWLGVGAALLIAGWMVATMLSVDKVSVGGPSLLARTSGLLVAAWPLTSLCMAWGLPLLLLIPYRGDIGDAFWLMGPYKDTTEPLLKVLNAPFSVISKQEEIRKAIVDAQGSTISWQRPVAVLLTGETIK